MPVLQPTPRRSASKGAALGRRLNAQRTMAASLVAATVEMEDEREIIARPGKYGVLYLVRSQVVANRYYPVTCRDGIYQHTTDETTAKRLIARIQAYLQELAAA